MIKAVCFDLLQRLGVPPEICLFVGDGRSDELYGAK